MKYNNSKNVINDSDVTLTSGKNIGKSLSDVLTTQQNEIDQLKGNVKWIYKYGGVGSGSGSGGSSTGKLTATATLNGNQILSGNTIQLSESVTSYTLTLSATGGGNYAAYVTYGENAERSATISLTSENVWRASYILADITVNGKINIEVTDGNGTSVYLSAVYAVKPFEIGALSLVNDNGDVYVATDGNTYIDMTTANNNGLLLSCDYKVSIAGKLQYYWEIPEAAKDPLVDIGTQLNPLSASEKSGTLHYKMPSTFLVDANAGDYDAAFNYRTVPDSGDTSEWTSKTVTFCIFPEGLYLSIIPAEAKSVYDKQEKEYSYNKFTVEKVLYGGLDGNSCWTSGPVYVNSGDAVSFEGTTDYKVGIASGTLDPSTQKVKISEVLSEESNLQVYYKASSSTTVFFYSTSKAITDELTYKKINVSDIYNYSVNRTITMYARIFTGVAVTGISDGKIEYSLDLNGTWYSIDNLTDGRSYSIPKIVFTTSGWHFIYFRYSFKGISGNPISKYVYITETDSSLNWFKKNSQIPASQKNFYRFNLKSSTFSDISESNPTTQANYNEISATDDNNWKIKVDNHASTSLSLYDFVINVGIQFSELNVESARDSSSPNPIFSVKSGSGYTEDNIIEVFQDGIKFKRGSELKVDMFLPKTDSEDYNGDVTSNYHLITLNYRSRKKPDDVSSTSNYSELVVYIDGVLEGALTQWLPYTIDISSIEFGKFNACINLLEVDFINPRLNNEVYSLSDADILYYYYTYWVKSNNDNTLVSAEKIKVLGTFYNLSNTINYDIKDEIVHLDEATYQTLVSEWSDIESTKKSGTKVMLLKTSRYNSNLKAGSTIDIIKEWMNGSYDENTDTGEVTAYQASWKVPVEVEWGQLGGGMADPLSGYTMQYEGTSQKVSDLVEFTIKLQGSSTMRFKSKNFTFGLGWKSGLNIDTTPVFSPNFLAADTSTFLPETAFTLKADVVDSSHSNNTSIGEFVNDVESGKLGSMWNVENIDMKHSGAYAGHVKKCLDGFPIILILNATIDDSTNDYYFLGIYNFNLGRTSYYNLGYCNLADLGSLPESTTNSFSFSTVQSIDIFEKFIAAEIQGNTKFWDFSQYQNSVLFPSFENDSNKYMFDDFVHNATNSGYQGYIRAFVKSIAKSGGYCFTQIGKTFDDIGADPGTTTNYYHVKDHVPDYTTQYKRSHINIWEKGYNTPDDAKSLVGNASDLKGCIDVYPIGEEENLPYLNYNSALYYYVICMAFGLVDSVQKNLNIKTWNNKTFGIYFYDMDTCLGIDNGGAFTSYFCFSDYWETAKGTAQTKEIVVDGVKTTVTYYPIDAKNCNIWRDYYPSDEHEGFDIPSSYLYAIPKYACLFNSNFENAVKSPATLWGEWRSAVNTTYPNGGPLIDADRFIDNYYKNHLGNIPEILINLNYRNKYLARTISSGSDVSFDSTASILHGRNFNRTRDWLRSRLHVLDAYFNLNSSPVEIYNKLQEPVPEGGNFQNNDDVYIYGEIFRAPGQTVMKRSGTLDFIVKAKDYSPFIIQEGSSYHRFFLADSDTYYGINFGYSGSVNASLGGSSLWTYVDSLNSFISTMQSGSSFYLSSNLLTNLIGNNSDSGGFNGATIEAPNAKTITLSSPNYSGILNIDSSYTNLTDFDISGSKISAIIRDDQNKNIGIRTINMSGIVSSNIEIANCPYLESTGVNLNSAEIQNCSISSVWKKNLDFSNTKIVSLSITNDIKVYPDATLTYSGNSSIKSISFSGFKTVYITNCPNLTNVTTSDIDTSVLTSLIITNCTSLTTVSLSGAKYSNILTTMNFDNCAKLSTLGLNSESDFSGLTTLNFNNTAIQTITWYGDDIPSPTDTDILNLKPFTSFSLNWKSGNKLTTTNMTKVKKIQFTNDKSNPAILTSNFTGCSELERVYGNIVMTAYGGFSGLNKFSIHGDDLSTLNWKGHTDLLDGARIKPTWEILKTECEAIDYTSLGLGWAPPSDQSKLINACYASGDKVTNIRFTTLGDALANTNFTLLDVYYALSMVYKAPVTYTNGYTSTITTEAGSAFYKSSTQGNKAYGMFFYNSEDEIAATETWPAIPSGDNSPNRYMFYYCSALNSIGWMFEDHSGATGHNAVYSKIKLFSPSQDESRNVTTNNGLYSPLVNAGNFYGVFYPRYPYFDRFLFRRTTEQGVLTNFAATQIGYVNSTVIVDDINNMETPPDLSNISAMATMIKNKQLGDAQDFFTNLPSLSTIYISFYGQPYLDYGTIKLPSAVTSVDMSFRSSYGTGSVNPTDIFTSGSNGKYVVEKITKSFVISNSTPATSYFNNATLEINNDTFKNFNALSVVGRNYTGDTRGSNERDVSYIGNGLEKTITTDTFPYDILDSCRSTISQFAGFFLNAHASSFGTGYKPALPGNMFRGCTNLTDISALFYMSNFQYTLSPTKYTDSDEDDSRYFNFRNCPKLEMCGYLFTDTISEHTAANPAKLTGSIPYKFFWHGEDTNTVQEKTGLWLDDSGNVNASGKKLYYLHAYPSLAEFDKEPSERTIEVIEGSYTIDDFLYNMFLPSFENWDEGKGTPTGRNVFVLTQGSFTYPTPFNTITTLSHCFEGADLSYYNATYGVGNSEYNDWSIERNPDYNFVSHTYTIAEEEVLDDVCKTYVQYEGKYYLPGDVIYDEVTGEITGVKEGAVEQQLTYRTEYTPTLSKNSKFNLKKWNFMWSYDGNSEHRPPSTYLNEGYCTYDVDASGNEILITDSGIYRPYACNDVNVTYCHATFGVVSNFMCPPDLLRYCANTSTLDLNNLFAYGGVQSWGTDYGSTVNLFDYGNTGRICPYLFKPVGNLTKMQYMFAYNRKLSGYAVYANEAATTPEHSYIIPQTLFKYLTGTDQVNMDYMFEYFLIPGYADLDVFKYMASTSLTLFGIFFRCYWGAKSETERITVSGIFSNFSVTGTKYAFALSSSIESTSAFPLAVYVTFNSVFRNYSSSAYSTNDNFTWTFANYIHRDSGVTYYIEETNKTVPINRSTDMKTDQRKNYELFKSAAYTDD